MLVENISLVVHNNLLEAVKKQFLLKIKTYQGKDKRENKGKLIDTPKSLRSQKISIQEEFFKQGKRGATSDSKDGDNFAKTQDIFLKYSFLAEEKIKISVKCGKYISTRIKPHTSLVLLIDALFIVIDEDCIGSDVIFYGLKNRTKKDLLIKEQNLPNSMFSIKRSINI